MPDTQLLSQLAYSNHRKRLGLPGATHAAVAKAIKSGRLSRCLHQENGKVLIDPVVADREWAANTNGVMQRGESVVTKTQSAAPDSHTSPESHSPAGTAPSVSQFDALGVMVTKGERSDSAIADAASLADSRAMKERYLALMAKLEYEIESGKLIDAEEARRAAFNAARKARNILLTIADRLAPVVAGLTDAFECHQAISKEVRRVCDELRDNPLEATDEPSE